MTSRSHDSAIDALLEIGGQLTSAEVEAEAGAERVAQLDWRSGFDAAVKRAREATSAPQAQTEPEPACEFCELDADGKHAPRCPITLEARIEALTSDMEILRHENVALKHQSDTAGRSFFIGERDRWQAKYNETRTLLDAANKRIADLTRANLSAH